MQIEKTSCPGQPVGKLSVRDDHTETFFRLALQRSLYTGNTGNKGQICCPISWHITVQPVSETWQKPHRDRTFFSEGFNSMSSVQSNVLVRCLKSMRLAGRIYQANANIYQKCCYTLGDLKLSPLNSYLTVLFNPTYVGILVIMSFITLISKSGTLYGTS